MERLLELFRQPQASRREDERPCPFCDILARRLPSIHFTTAKFFVITPLCPINDGHLLLIPKRHIETPFEMNRREAYDFRTALRRAKDFLDERYEPQGYNIGVNIGTVAGQAVFHLHFHLVPRFMNDVEDPRGGILRNLLRTYRCPHVKPNETAGDR